MQRRQSWKEPLVLQRFPIEVLSMNFLRLKHEKYEDYRKILYM